MDPAMALSPQSAPFVIVYDAAHRVLPTTAPLDETTPGLPSGTLDDAVSRGGTSVTLRPRAGVREAVIARPWSGPRHRGSGARRVLVLTAALVVLRRGNERSRPTG
jgi:hypothetical protein